MAVEKYSPKPEDVQGLSRPEITLWRRPVENEVLVGVLEGGLNRNIVYQSVDGDNVERYVLRIPRPEEDRLATMQAIQLEYDGIGATAAGISFRLRSLSDQAAFIDETRKKGFKTLPYHGLGEGEMAMPFINGVALSKYVGQEKVNPDIIKNILEHMGNAHGQGFTFGDRWTPNTIISSDDDFTEIDFDIELQGEHEVVAAFELSQTVFHLLHFSADRTWMQETLVDFYRQHPNLLQQYNSEYLQMFMQGHASYFREMYEQDGPYEGLIPPYDEAMTFVDSIQNSTSGAKPINIQEYTIYTISS